jgi:glycosyltransferase involved in cell wall biosynthesis
MYRFKENIDNRKVAVISAVNIVEGGTLTILNDCIEFAEKTLGPNWRIVVLVHRRSLIASTRVDCIEFPRIKQSWFFRLYMEWFGWLDFSKDLKPDLWLSLHDITPRVWARRQAVYCHNPSPFYNLSISEAFLDPTFALFNMFYARLYGLLINRNHTVIVQQNWLREAFSRLYAHPNIIVSYPTYPYLKTASAFMSKDDELTIPRNEFVLLYPALPRVFKNVELLCEAIKLVPPDVASCVELRLTMDGTENAYARDLHRRYKNIKAIRFIGRKNRQQMTDEYLNCDVVLFPSKLETWGLPITESKSFKKPIVIADLPYAHETAGNCSAVTFLPPDNSEAWANVISKIVRGEHLFGTSTARIPVAPFASDWKQLWLFLTKNL